MLTRMAFQQLLHRRGFLIIDGALATELECRGHDLSHPLWSGQVLHKSPGSIQQVHADYFVSGADIAITSTYQVSVRGLMGQLDLSEHDAKELIMRSVRIARAAATHSDGVPEHRTLLIAGSVGPYGAYLADGSEYRGDYSMSQADMKDFHRGRIQALVEADVDLLVLETMPNLEEIQALLNLLAEEYPSAIALVSCTLRDAQHISDGSSIEQVLASLHQNRSQVVGFGVNCVPPGIVLEFLSFARPLTDLPLLCYPNSGEIYDGSDKTWSGHVTKNDLATKAINEWWPAGARLIGGCCRTTPQDIRCLADALRDEQKQRVLSSEHRPS